MWTFHYDLGVKLCDRQSDMAPLQRLFLALAANKYGPDDSDIPNDARL